MCNLYSMTRNREAILRLFRVAHLVKATVVGTARTRHVGDGAEGLVLHPSLPLAGGACRGARPGRVLILSS